MVTSKSPPSLASTLEGWDTVDKLGGDLLVTIGDKYGPVAELEAATILAYLIPSLFIDDLIDISIKDFKIVVKKAIEVMVKLGNLLITKIEQIGKKLLETGIYIGNKINKFAMDAGKALVKLNNFITGLYNNVLIAGATSGVAIMEFSKKATAAVSSFFVKVGEGARTFSSMLIKEIKAKGEFVVDKGQRASKLIERKSIRIKEQSKSFAKGAFRTTKAGINVVAGKRVIKQRKLSVNFNRLEDMQRKTKNLEIQLEQQIYRALNEVERLMYGVGHNYNEYYIRQQINTINNLCRQLRRDGNSTCHRIQRSTKSLQYALSHYKQIEQSLCKDIGKITVYT
jgi:hypothetical protein